jgi:hypothetical protein
MKIIFSVAIFIGIELRVRVAIHLRHIEALSEDIRTVFGSKILDTPPCHPLNLIWRECPTLCSVAYRRLQQYRPQRTHGFKVWIFDQIEEKGLYYYNKAPAPLPNKKKISLWSYVCAVILRYAVEVRGTVRRYRRWGIPSKLG